MTGKRSLSNRIERLEEKHDERSDPDTVALWRRFITGNYDSEDPHPAIQEWLKRMQDADNPAWK